MRRRGFSLGVYRMVLSLHPAPFRERFSDEMLWIVGETIAEFGTRRLLIDVFCSLIRQWAARDPVLQSVVSRRPFAPAGSVSAATLTKATVIASVTLMGFFMLLQQNVRLPQPPRTFEVRRAPLDLRGGYKLQHHRRGR